MPASKLSLEIDEKLGQKHTSGKNILHKQYLPFYICPILALCIDSFRIVIKKNVHVLKHAEKLI